MPKQVVARYSRPQPWLRSCMLFLLIVPPAMAKTIAVNSPGDQGDGDLGDGVVDTGSQSSGGLTGLRTLRAALQNAVAGDLIVFDAEVEAIRPATALPPVPCSIDGGGRVEISGELQSGAHLLELTTNAHDVTIAGLTLTRSPGDGLRIVGQAVAAPTTITVTGCIIGLPPGGHAGATHGNAGWGIAIAGANHVTVRDCTIAANGAGGVTLQSAFGQGGPSTFMRLTGNRIGTDGAGETAAPNAGPGIELGEEAFANLSVSDATIGGSAAGEANTISGNAGPGIRVHGDTFDDRIRILGNRIGTDAGGRFAIPNAGAGIHVSAHDNLMIGGAAAGEANVIAGNTGSGVEISGSSTSRNTVAGNRIGVGVNGQPIPNGQHGVLIRGGALNNLVGGDELTTGSIAGVANIIADNSGAGVAVIGATTRQNRIRGNSIDGNGGLGIDLNGDGVTPNDPADSVQNANREQNFPLVAALAGDAATTISGSLDSNVNPPHRVDFYANTQLDPSRHGEGRVWIGSVSVPFGQPIFRLVVPGRWENVVATATDNAGNTSEFSRVDTLELVVNSLGDAPDLVPGDGICDTGALTPLGERERTLRAAIMEANARAGHDFISFNVRDAGGLPVLEARIAPDSELPPITEALSIDGTTQPPPVLPTLAQAPPPQQVVIDGHKLAGQVSGQRVRDARVELRGLHIMNFGFGIDITGDKSSGSVIAACTIRNMTSVGIVGQDADELQIGGDTPADRNVIYGCLTGIDLRAKLRLSGGHRITGNWIGYDISGPIPGIATTAISIVGRRNVIGGPTDVPGEPPGNVIGRGRTGISLLGDENLVAGNLIGVGPANENIGNSSLGIGLLGGDGNRIGGSGERLRNVIGFNLCGIAILAAGTMGAAIESNHIGVGADGIANASNRSDGIAIGQNLDPPAGGLITIGAAAAAPGDPPGNLILGNDENGIRIKLSLSPIRIVIAGNVINSNHEHGIIVDRGGGITIGGRDAGNVIAGNHRDGIQLNDDTITSVTIQANRIGVNQSGDPQGNGINGVHVRKANTVLIGGAGAGEGNTIAFNGDVRGAGIAVAGSAERVAAVGNAIYANTHLGIDLSALSREGDGPTANDAGDGDLGSNRSQNFPVLSAASISGGSLRVSGQLASVASRQYSIEFFGEPAADRSGHGEGRVFLGRLNGSTNAQGTLSFANHALGLPPTPSLWISATATDILRGETSEFSVAIRIAAPDSDGDGAPDSIEDLAPNSGDGNGDGIPDRQQPEVVSTLDARLGRPVTLRARPPAGQDAGPRLAAVMTIHVNPIDAPPEGLGDPAIEHPIGLFGVTVGGLAPGGAAVVELYPPAGMSFDRYIKYGRLGSGGAEPSRYDFGYNGATGATLGSPITLALVDGGRGDDDLAADGTIRDPGGAAEAGPGDTGARDLVGFF